MKQPESTRGDLDAPLFPPEKVLLLGLGLTAMALVWRFATDWGGGLRLLLVVAGLSLVGGALWMWLPRLGRDQEGRLMGGGLWLVGTVGTILARFALEPWDSLVFLCWVLTFITVIAAIVTALNPRWRPWAISALVLFHLGGLATAVSMVPPPEGNAPWVPSQIWTWVYNSYLSMTNLNNGYHFYSPEPGPTALLFFRVEYADGSAVWRRLPDHEASQNHLHRRRMGSLVVAMTPGGPVAPQRFRELVKNREEAAAKPGGIPLAPRPAERQYREPGTRGRLLLSSYARYVARTTPNLDDPEMAITSIKIYYAEFFHPAPQNIAEGQPFMDVTQYEVFYMGEYDDEGTLSEACLKVTHDQWGVAQKRTQDPYVYWQMPIVRVNADDPDLLPPGMRATAISPRNPDRFNEEGRVVNWMFYHAGDLGRNPEEMP